MLEILLVLIGLAIAVDVVLFLRVLRLTRQIAHQAVILKGVLESNNLIVAMVRKAAVKKSTAGKGK